MKKQVRLTAFEPTTTDRFLRVSQMTVQNFLRQSQRSVIQELADQRKFFLKSMVRRCDGSAIFLLEWGVSRQTPSRDKNPAGPTT